MRNPIDLGEIIQKSGLKVKDVATALFPSNNRPEQALHRIQTGKGQLSEGQILKLAAITGFTIEQLFGLDPDWVLSRNDNIVTVCKGGISADLDMDTFVATVKDEDSIIFVDKLLMSESITLRDFIILIQNILKEQKHGSNIRFEQSVGFETPERTFLGPIGADGTRPGDDYKGVDPAEGSEGERDSEES